MKPDSLLNEGVVNQSNAKSHLIIGRISAFLVFILGLIYAVVTFIGLNTLESANDPIGDPWFTLMELLILIIAPCMVVSITALHLVADKEMKIYTLTALIFMILLAGITSCVHFSILTVIPKLDQSLSWVRTVFAFKWPSVVYALDILAWDWFFALSMLFSVPVFKGDGREKVIRYLFLISGILSLAGVLGVLLDNMNIRNIGIAGYGVVAPVAFLFLALYFNKILDRITL